MRVGTTKVTNLDTKRDYKMNKSVPKGSTTMLGVKVLTPDEKRDTKTVTKMGRQKVKENKTPGRPVAGRPQAAKLFIAALSGPRGPYRL